MKAFVSFILGSIILTQSVQPADLQKCTECVSSCQFGLDLSNHDCSTCQCKKTPCEDNEEFIPDYRCGHSETDHDCPSSHHCKVDQNDRYAVCCPNRRSEIIVQKRQEKPGMCPIQRGVGLCFVECNDDSECKENQKCCGSCPRTCVDPLL